MTHKNYVQNLAATHLSFEHFMHHFIVYRSIDHRKLQSICLIQMIGLQVVAVYFSASKT